MNSKQADADKASLNSYFNVMGGESPTKGNSVENLQNSTSTSSSEKSVLESVASNVNSSESSNGPLYFPSQEPKEARLARIKTSANPIMEAASVLLRVMAEMPKAIDQTEANFFHSLLIQEINTYTQLCDEANLRHDHKLAVRYVICSALDEFAGENSIGDKDKPDNRIGYWSSRSLLQHFHQEGYGGKTVFLVVGKLAESPDEHLHVLEIILKILLLGFQGAYRSELDGQKNLNLIKNRLHKMVTDRRSQTTKELSVHWQVESQGKGSILRFIPLWLVASLLGLFILGVFAVYKYNLVVNTQETIKKIEAVAKPPTKPKPAARLTLKQLLEPEIEAKKVVVDEVNGKTIVQIKSDGMFEPGGANVKPEAVVVLGRIASAINDVPGQVQVVGHTDNIPPAGKIAALYVNNQGLSEARAKEVASIFQKQGVVETRLKVMGSGDSNPIDSNQTVSGRSKNRRVELIVTN
jgi:type VI secretion system protein ImpK